MNTSFLGMFSTLLKAVDIVSLVILVIMMLILGNTIAMGVRERTHEYGVLRAIGFMPRHIATLVLGEALAIGFAGGVLGVAASRYPLINQVRGRVHRGEHHRLLPLLPHARARRADRAGDRRRWSSAAVAAAHSGVQRAASST